MDATTPPRRDDEPAAGEVPAPLTEPAPPRDTGGSTAVGAGAPEPPAGTGPVVEPASAPAPASAAVVDDGPEDPTVPDTAVEATVASEPAGSSPEEPVVPTAHADEVATTSAAAPEQRLDSDEEPPDEVAGPQSQPVPASAHLGSGRGGASEPEPGAGQPAEAPQREIVYVAAPQPPKRKGNRGMGVLIAAISTVIFLVVYVLFVLLLQPVFGGGLDTEFLRNPRFYIPVLLFAVAFILLALIVNRAGWWSFVLGSLFVGIFTYLGTIGVLLLLRAAELTPETAELAFRQLLVSPTAIAAGLVAREVALWAGAAISARGRRVTARNAEARAEFERDEAERKAEIERHGAVIRERVSVR